MIWIGIVLLLAFCVYWSTILGYLVQKFKFGNSFKEVYEYHKEQDKLEALHEENKNDS